MKLLIVDDNEAMRRLIKSLLRKIADEIYECNDGIEAVETYARRRPDFVMMDIEMAAMNGIQATQTIRTIDPHARVIIVTNHDDGNYREAAYDAGACGYVVKEDLLQLKRLILALNGDRRDF